MTGRLKLCHTTPRSGKIQKSSWLLLVWVQDIPGSELFMRGGGVRVRIGRTQNVHTSGRNPAQAVPLRAQTVTVSAPDLLRRSDGKAVAQGVPPPATPKGSRCFTGYGRFAHTAGKLLGGGIARTRLKGLENFATDPRHLEGLRPDGSGMACAVSPSTLWRETAPQPHRAALGRECVHCRHRGLVPVWRLRGAQEPAQLAAVCLVMESQYPATRRAVGPTERKRPAQVPQDDPARGTAPTRRGVTRTGKPTREPQAAQRTKYLFYR